MLVWIKFTWQTRMSMRASRCCFNLWTVLCKLFELATTGFYAILTILHGRFYLLTIDLCPHRLKVKLIILCDVANMRKKHIHFWLPALELMSLSKAGYTLRSVSNILVPLLCCRRRRNRILGRLVSPTHPSGHHHSQQNWKLLRCEINYYSCGIASDCLWEPH